ncbi:hypothetical protein PS627_00243 [Pseudomonas fluorescens]|uniref:hypothetical protein n=1 Tax=Pseudomonas fluorescens TaxID=294 RepID=UPI00125C3094|nr:hypothetical protein [Pseudomonas fluorescens]CAG8863307.1 hypothetical protein PS627_00243 [Pseudomonas fluorescens]
MTIDLDALPRKMELLPSPRKGGWIALVLQSGLLGSGSVVLLWPADGLRGSLWFWCCAVVLPVIPGVLLFAFRRLAHERQQDFALAWNTTLEEQELKLIQHGQRAAGLLATAYCTPAGNNRLAHAILMGSKPLQPVYLQEFGRTMRLSQLVPTVQASPQLDYVERLKPFLQQVTKNLQPDLLLLGCTTPVRLRIKHNQIVPDTELLALWHSCVVDGLSIDAVDFTQDDGLLWLEAWLDESEPCDLLLSLEINLFVEPIEAQAESVSALLVAHPRYAITQSLAPKAWIHRPVPMTNHARSLRDALLWGRVGEKDQSLRAACQTQVSGDEACAASILLAGAGHALAPEQLVRLDDSFGRPGSAVANIALVVASEQAASTGESQLIMLRDASSQWCVVSPAL